jgi:glycosyltransferase involved in cell wall biosynthesis
MPANLRFYTRSAGSKVTYCRAVTGLAAGLDHAALVICSHLHLLPFAHILALRFRSHVLPVVYGLEAWKPTTHASVNYLCGRIRSFIAIRKLTADRLRHWAGIPDAHFHYLPNCIDIDSYGIRPKRTDLIAKFGLEGRTVVMTAGRMDIAEKNKGFDEVIETFPHLLKQVPEAVYLLIGDGKDRPRLEEKGRAFGVADRLIFAGYVPEREKADYYRLADVVAMPGSDPYFDRYPYRFAFLEPLACGVPVVGSKLEETSERDDPDAKRLLIQVDPHDPADITRGILTALTTRVGGINPALSNFTYDKFEQNAHKIIENFLSAPC